MRPLTETPKTFLCVKETPEGDIPRCEKQCWQCQHIEEVEELDQPEDE